MYKIFINNRPLIIADEAVKENMIPGTLLLHDDSENVLELLINLANTETVYFKQVYLISKNPEKLFELFQSKFKIILASGGLVKNEEGKVLLIFRNGKWDLPKGKLEKNETPEVAGIREVEEECGIKKLTIVKTLSPTYHTYLHKEKMILKKTFWYEMSCADKKELIPQIEEGITEVKWMSETEVKEAMKNTFLSVIDVLGER